MKQSVFLVVLAIGLAATVIMPSSQTYASIDYFGYQEYGGTWQDANKTWSNDSQLCWAASASNVLAWAGWGTSQYNTATTIFDQFKTYWPNSGGWPVNGWSWWLNGTTKEGAGYWPNQPYNWYYNSASFNGNNPGLLNNINSYLHAGYGVNVSIHWAYWWGLAHSITIWGIGTKDDGSYSGLWITDSDDHQTGMFYYELIEGSLNFADNTPYSEWYITDAFAFNRNPNPAPVPLPPSVWLLGSGLIGLVGLRRKFFRK